MITALSLQIPEDAQRPEEENCKDFSWLRKLSGVLEDEIWSQPLPQNPLNTLQKSFPRFLQAATHHTFFIFYAFGLGSFLRPKILKTWFQLKSLW